MATYKWYYQLISATRTSEPHDAAYKVAGPLCDGGDVYFDIEGEDRLPDHRLLPANVRPVRCWHCLIVERIRWLKVRSITAVDSAGDLDNRRWRG